MGRRITLTNGNDTFRQGEVANNAALILRSLAGNDSILLNRTDDLGGSNDVFTAAGNDVVVNDKEFGNAILLGDGNDVYVGRGFGSFSSDIRDEVYGGNGNDRFLLETFHSVYFGGAGNDTFTSVGWQNAYAGGTGIDTISYIPRSSESTATGGVTVDLRAGLVQTGAFRQERLASIENVVGSHRGDAIFGSGVANRITGANGFDELTGRAGADTFVYSNKFHAPVSSNFAEVITDFSRAQGDRIDLHGMDANLNAAGNQDFKFITTGFTGRAGQVRFDGDFVIGDLNGDRIGDFRIFMNNLNAMQASDFVL